MVFLVGFVVGILCSGVVVAVAVLRRREQSCSGVLAIDDDNAMFLELDEAVESVKSHKLIFLKVISV